MRNIPLIICTVIFGLVFSSKTHAQVEIITTAVGGGGSLGDGGQATAAQMNTNYMICLDAAGNLYIADQNNSRIRKVDATTKIITTIAGNGTAGYLADGGAATGTR